MITDFHIFHYNFNDDPFEVLDETDIDFWMTVTVGDGVAGAYYQVRVCSPKNLNKDKKNFFVLNYWEGEEKLIEEMNSFIEVVVGKNTKEDPYFLLSKHWEWEYEGM